MSQKVVIPALNLTAIVPSGCLGSDRVVKCCSPRVISVVIPATTTPRGLEEISQARATEIGVSENAILAAVNKVFNKMSPRVPVISADFYDSLTPETKAVALLAAGKGLLLPSWEKVQESVYNTWFSSEEVILPSAKVVDIHSQLQYRYYGLDTMGSRDRLAILVRLAAQGPLYPGSFEERSRFIKVVRNMAWTYLGCSSFIVDQALFGAAMRLDQFDLIADLLQDGLSQSCMFLDLAPGGDFPTLCTAIKAKIVSPLTDAQCSRYLFKFGPGGFASFKGDVPNDVAFFDGNADVLDVLCQYPNVEDAALCDKTQVPLREITTPIVSSNFAAVLRTAEHFELCFTDEALLESLSPALHRDDDTVISPLMNHLNKGLEVWTFLKSFVDRIDLYGASAMASAMITKMNSRLWHHRRANEWEQIRGLPDMMGMLFRTVLRGNSEFRVKRAIEDLRDHLLHDYKIHREIEEVVVAHTTGSDTTTENFLGMRMGRITKEGLTGIYFNF